MPRAKVGFSGAPPIIDEVPGYLVDGERPTTVDIPVKVAPPVKADAQLHQLWGAVACCQGLYQHQSHTGAGLWGEPYRRFIVL